VFSSSSGELLASVGDGRFTGVVVHGSSVFAVDDQTESVSVFQ
jgi:hypothetical protein